MNAVIAFMQSFSQQQSFYCRNTCLKLTLNTIEEYSVLPPSPPLGGKLAEKFSVLAKKEGGGEDLHFLNF